MCRIREKRLQDCKVVSHQRYSAPLGVWGICLCCRAAWGLLPHNMTWCPSLIPHHIISHYFCLIHRHWLILRDMHLPFFFFSSSSPLLPFSSLLSSTRLPNPKQFPQTSDLTPYRNLNIEFPLFLLHGFHLKPWPWRLERTKRSGSLGWLHAISYSFSNLNQTSFIYAFSSLNYNMRWDLQRVCLYHLSL